MMMAMMITMSMRITMAMPMPIKTTINRKDLDDNDGCVQTEK